MKVFKSLALLMVITLAFYSCIQQDVEVIANNRPFTLSSEITDTDYRINLWYPDNYSAEKGYHLLYLLDGDAYFAEAVEVTKNYNPNDFIVIGIGYRQKNYRGRDYAYPEDKEFPGESGGGKNFIRFLNQELIPYVENELGVISLDKSLFGHSLGGYLSLYLLFQQDQPNYFDYHIAASPNLMWYNAYLFDLEKLYSVYDIHLNHPNVYVSMGDLEGTSLNTSFNAFHKQINQRAYHEYFNFERLENTSHRNSPIVSLENALNYLF